LNIRHLLAAALLAGLGTTVRAAEPPTAAEFQAVAGTASPSLVRVEFTLRYDKGEPPRAGGWTGGGAFSSREHMGFDPEGALAEERPMEVGGFLVSPTKVILPDPMIHPRFVESIAVRFGADVVKAKPVAYPKNQSALILELERPLKEAKPLAFDAKRKGPYFSVTYGFGGGAWTIGVDGMPAGLIVEQPDRKSAPATLDALVVDRTGGPVGMTLVEEIPTDDSWKGSPLSWPAYSADEMAKLLADIEKNCDAGILRVTLYFRSPRKEAGQTMRSMRGEGAGSGIEEHVSGVLLGDNKVLVLAGMRPKLTARLERITLTPPKGEPVPAKFVCSLTDYGALVVSLEKPLAGGAPLSAMPVLNTRNLLLPAAQVLNHGEERTVHFQHLRVGGFALGWHKQLYPLVGDNAPGQFLFDPQGALLAVPVARREKIAPDDRYRNGPLLTPVLYLSPVLENLPAHSDPSNIPVTEAEESRLAWMGIELQPLSPELARLNKASEQTQDGATGGLVAYVYPDSPAAKAEIKQGDILLRLRVEGEPRPLEVVTDAGDREFPWDEYDQISPQYYERLYTPWAPAESRFVRALTDLGFGKKFTAEFLRDGKLFTKEFTVTQAPPQYEAAPRYKSAPLGLTVRDLTFEVRRYFTKKDDEPGVIISRIEPGGKASVVGMKPYEIITHVNGTAVKDVKEFEKAAAETQGEMRLSVKRLNQGRVVKIKLDAPKGPEKPAAEPEAGSDNDSAAPAEKPAAEKPAGKPAEKPAPAPSVN
jgi:serine protease Do